MVCGPQASHMLGSLLGSQGLIDVPPRAELAAGTEVEVHFWEQPGS
jgi:molybdopterin biosynthesis enzyme